MLHTGISWNCFIFVEIVFRNSFWSRYCIVVKEIELFMLLNQSSKEEAEVLPLSVISAAIAALVIWI